MPHLQSLFGIFLFIGIAFALSNDRKSIQPRIIWTGLLLQITLALLVLGIPALHWHGPLHFFFQKVNDGILSLLAYTDSGSAFLFSKLVDTQSMGYIFAFKVLPLIVFVSSLMAVLYHLKIMQWIVYSFAVVMSKFMKISGAESLAAAANVFVGQTEAPLVIRPYLKNLTSSELFSIMTGGMATVAGAVLGAFVGLLSDFVPHIGGHLLAASLISAPAALMIAKIIFPENETPETLGQTPKVHNTTYVNIFEAAAEGASEGVTLAINVGGMLLAFVALIALGDGLLDSIGRFMAFDHWGQSLTPHQFLVDGEAKLSLSLILGWLFVPVSFFLGVPLQDVFVASSLIGKKIVLNEFIAFEELARLAQELQPRTLVIMSYGLCGFANFSSIAIQLGGIGSLAPHKKKEIAKFGLKAMVGGNLAAFLTAGIAGLLIP